MPCYPSPAKRSKAKANRRSKPNTPARGSADPPATLSRRNRDAVAIRNGEEVRASSVFSELADDPQSFGIPPKDVSKETITTAGIASKEAVEGDSSEHHSPAEGEADPVAEEGEADPVAKQVASDYIRGLLKAVQGSKPSTFTKISWNGERAVPEYTVTEAVRCTGANAREFSKVACVLNYPPVEYESSGLLKAKTVQQKVTGKPIYRKLESGAKYVAYEYNHVEANVPVTGFFKDAVATGHEYVSEGEKKVLVLDFDPEIKTKEDQKLCFVKNTMCIGELKEEESTDADGEAAGVVTGADTIGEDKLGSHSNIGGDDAASEASEPAAAVERSPCEFRSPLSGDEGIVVDLESTPRDSPADLADSIQSVEDNAMEDNVWHGKTTDVTITLPDGTTEVCTCRVHVGQVVERTRHPKRTFVRFGPILRK